MSIIPIFFSANDNYVPIMSVMIRSIMENANNERKYEIIILHRDISENGIQKLRKMVAEFPYFSISFFDFSLIIENSKFFISRHISVETYFRLWIPSRFPQYDKAIYLDGDMVCRADISQLFDTDISNYLVGGVRDMAVAWYFQPKKLQNSEFRKIYEYIQTMENPSDYINAGMLLINCEKIRQIYSEKSIVDTIFSREWQVHDQDIINFLAKDKILHMDYKWNYMPTKWAQYLPQNLKDEYFSAKENPKILHFKPYQYWWYVPFFDEFWKYATRTPFVKKIVAKTNKNGIFEKEELEEKICFIAQTRAGFGGKAIIKTILSLLTRFSKK